MRLNIAAYAPIWRIQNIPIVFEASIPNTGGAVHADTRAKRGHYLECVHLTSEAKRGYYADVPQY